MLYEIVTGQLPFEASDPVAIISQHIHAPVVPPRARREDITPGLNDLILSLMEKDPKDRPASSSEVRKILSDPIILECELDQAPDIHALDRIVRGRIIGRESHIHQARNIWQKARNQEGQLLLISGEPGIGKTRLTREIRTLAEVSGGMALIGECYSEGNPPYDTFAQIVRKGLARSQAKELSLPDPVMADLLTLAPDLAHQYPGIPPNPKLDPETEQQRLFEHVVTFFSTLAEKVPLMLAVEDGHWADEGSLKMLRYLVRRLQRSAVMLVVTYREVELREARPFQEVLTDFNRERLGVRIKLTRLSRTQTKDMLAAIFSEEITPEFLDSIYQETKGNPFFIEEICRALIEHGDLWYSDGQWDRPSIEEMHIPQGIQSAVESRLFRLPEECQTALQMAALLGREFDYEVLLHTVAMNEDTLIDAIETCERAQLIQLSSENGATIFSFVHALIPAAIKESTHTLRRRKLHKKAAEAIAQLKPNDLEALAYHYAEAGDEVKALDYYRRSAKRALSSYANQDAERLFRTALTLEEIPANRADLLANLGMALVRLSRFSEAIATWHQAIELYFETNQPDAAAGLYARVVRAEGDKANNNAAGLAVCRQGMEAVKHTDTGGGPG